MSFKIIKGRKIQEWLEETLRHIFITLKGEEILLDLKKLPLPLKETIVVHAAEPYNASSDPMVKTFASMLGVDYSVSKKRMEQYNMKRGSNYMHKEYVQPVTVKSLKEEIAYKYSWSEKAPFPLIFKKYLEFNYKSLSTIIEEAENEPINIEERISGGWKTGGTWAGTGWAFKGYIYEMEYKNQPPYSKEEEELLILEQYDNEQNKFESLKENINRPILRKNPIVEKESAKKLESPFGVAMMVNALAAGTGKTWSTIISFPFLKVGEILREILNYYARVVIGRKAVRLSEASNFQHT